MSTLETKREITKITNIQNQWLDNVKKNKYTKFEPNIPCGSRVMSIFTKRAQPAKMMLGEAWSLFSYQWLDNVKDLYSTAPKRGSVFIGLMTPDGAIWSRYQRTALMR